MFNYGHQLGRRNAVIKFGGGVAAMSGSIGGTVFARNKGGAYARQWAKPCNPRSPLQNTRRAEMAYFAKAWSNVLTPQERIDWGAYAKGTSWTNKLGDSIEIAGNAAFMRLNCEFAVLDFTIETAAPTAMGHAGGINFTFLAENDTGKLQFDLPTGSYDNRTNGQHILVYQGVPTEVGRIATPKGFKFLTHIRGHQSTPHEFPLEIATAYTMNLGQFITLKAMFIDENNRMSGPFFSSVVAADAAV